MTEKKEYNIAKIALVSFDEGDVIATSGEASSLGTAGSDDGGWTTWPR